MVDETPAPLTPLQQYKSTFTGLADTPDDQVIDSLYGEYGKASGMDKRDFALAWQGRGPRMSPLQSGIAGLKTSYLTTKAGVAQSLGADESARNYLKEAETIEADTKARYQPEFRSFDDVRGPIDLAKYTAEKFGESAPQMAAQAAGALALTAASAIAPVAAPVGIGARVLYTGLRALAGTTTRAAVTGSTAVGLPLYTGANLQRQMDEGAKFEDVSLGRATAAAALQSTLDSISLATVFKGLPGSMLQKGGIFRQAVIRGVESGATESLTETAQQALEIMQANPQKLFEFGADVQKELKEAAIAGAILGGAMGGVAGGVQKGFERKPKPVDDTTTQQGGDNTGGGGDTTTDTSGGALPPPTPGYAPRTFGSEGLTEPSIQRADPRTGKPVVEVGLTQPVEQVVPGNITTEAQDLIRLVDQGNMQLTPAITPELQRILQENGIAVEASDTSDTALEKLRAKATVAPIIKDKVGVHFTNDFDRALFYANSPNIDEATRQEYEDFLTHQGLDKTQILELGLRLEDKIQEEAKTHFQLGNEGPLTLDFSRREAAEIYNNLPQVADTWKKLQEQGYSAEQINEEMSGEAAYTNATRGNVSDAVQKDTGIFYYDRSPPRTNDPNAVAAVPDKTFKRKLESKFPGLTSIMENIAQRLFPGTDIHFFNEKDPNNFGSFAGIWRYKVDPSARRPGAMGIAINLHDILKGAYSKGKQPSPRQIANLVHTILHELSHPAVDSVLTRLNAADMEAVMQQYASERNSIAIKREAAARTINQHTFDLKQKGPVTEQELADLKDRVAKRFGVSVSSIEKFIADPSVNELGAFWHKDSQELTYRRDFQEWAAEKGMRWMLQEIPGRMPETVLDKFAAAVLKALRQVYETIEAAFGIPYTPGAFEKAMADTWGAHDRTNVNKQLAEKMILDPRNNATGGPWANGPFGPRPYYSSAELQVGPDEYSRSTSQFGALAGEDQAKYSSPIEDLPKEPREKREQVKADKTQTAPENTQLQPTGNVETIVRKLRPEVEQKETGIKAFFKGIRDLLKGNSWRGMADFITEKLADNMIKVLRLDERYAAEMKKQGRPLEAGYDQRYPATARLSAYAAALARDNSLAMVETILHHGGSIEYVKTGNEATDGYIRVNRNGNKGLTFLGDLIRAGKLERWRDYAMAKRIAGLTERGLKTPITVAEANVILREYGQDADIVKAYESFQKHNNSMIKLAVDTGVITKEAGAMFVKNNDYYPFYREMEEGKGFSGPIFTAGLISPTKIAKAMGGTEHLKNDPVEVILKNTHFWANAAAKNVASNKMYTMMKFLGEASDLPAKGGVVKPGEIEGTTRIKGKEQRFVIKTPDLAAAMESMGASPMPNWTKIPGAFTSFYRELVTRDPTYIFKNLMRDPFSAMVTSGVNFNPFKAFSNFARALKNPDSMESLLALQNFGILGGYKSLPNMENASKLLGKGFDPASIQQGSVFVVPDANTLTGIISKSWNALGRMSEASDAATRTAIYEEVLAKTGNEAEAAFRAQEVMNFRKHGTNQAIRILSMMVPFVNGRIQGISVAAQAFADGNRMHTLVKGGMLFGAAMALQGLTADDKDYLQLPDYVRQGSLVVPLKVLGISDKGFLAIPKPFEMGFIFQTIPELMIQAYGTDSKEDRAVKTVIANYLGQTFGISPFPSIIAPIAEVYFNRSSMTGLPIITQSMEHLPPELQYTAATSDIIKNLGQATGISPAKLETIVKGYGGQVITTMLTMLDGMYRASTGKGVEKDFTQYQPVSTFIKTEKNTNPQGVADIYRLSAEIQGLTTGLNNYISYGMIKEADNLVKENQGLFALKQTIGNLRNQLNTLSRQERIVMNNDAIPQEDRTRMVDSLREARRQISSAMPDLIKQTGK